MTNYVQQSWADEPATTSPVSSARLNHMEEGIAAAAAATEPATGATLGTVQLGGDLAGTGTAPTVPRRVLPVYNFNNTDPARPNTEAAVLWVCPDTDRPATNGTTAGGAYAGAEGDFMFTYT